MGQHFYKNLLKWINKNPIEFSQKGKAVKLPNRINFEKIHKLISSYHNIPNELNKISLLLNGGEKLERKAIFEFEKGNLYAKIHLNKDLELGTRFQASFGPYLSDNAYAISSPPSSSSHMFEYKIMLNDIRHSNTYSKTIKYNIAVFNRHKNMQRFDTIIDCSPTNIAFKFCGKNFHMYSIENEHLAIVCESKIKYEEFLKYITSIQIALDFLNAEISGELMYIFSAKLENENVKDIECCKIIHLAPSASLNFDIFITYPMQDALTDKEVIRLSKEQFEKLCTLTHQESQFRTTIDCILHSSRVSLEYTLIFLSIALESSAKYEKVKDGHKIMDEEKFKPLKKDLDELIDNKNELNDKEKSTLKNKITNYAPNNKLLQMPFDKYNIKLNDEEKDILKRRNEVLHARAVEYSSDIMSDFHKYQKEAKILYLMLYEIILKTIGYDGYIININKYDEIVKFINSHNGNKPIKFECDFIKSLK